MKKNCELSLNNSLELYLCWFLLWETLGRAVPTVLKLKILETIVMFLIIFLHGTKGLDLVSALIHTHPSRIEIHMIDLVIILNPVHLENCSIMNKKLHLCLIS